MPIPEAVLFDLDGTLLDTAQDFFKVMNEMLSAHQRPPIHFDALREKVSDGARAMVKLGFEISEGEPGFNELRSEFLARYEACLAESTSLFEGMEQVLNQIEAKGIPWGIVTNKPSLYAEAVLKGLKLIERCAVLVCPDHVTNTKPDPEPIFLACTTLNVKAENSLYVGDHIRDIQAGQNAGCTTIACSYGYLHKTENIEDWKANHVIHAPLELINHL